MKKVIGIFSVAAIAVTMFVNTSNINSTNSDMSLLDAISLNSADAESGCVAAWDRCEGYNDHRQFEACMHGAGC